MNDYIQKINILEEDVARMTTSSNIVYDQTYHMWLIGCTNDLVQEIHNDKVLADDDQKQARLSLVYAVSVLLKEDLRLLGLHAPNQM